jgi:two-component system phosphate regulon sensor histidine kinase PhoR
MLCYRRKLTDSSQHIWAINHRLTFTSDVFIFLYSSLQKKFFMRSSTLRWILLITSIIMGLLVSAQLYWLNKIYTYEQKEFYTSVIKSIQGVYEDLELTNAPGAQLRKLIEHPDANSFLFRVDSIPAREVLFDDMLDNLENFQVFSACHLSVFTNGRLLYQGNLPSLSPGMSGKEGRQLQPAERKYSYIKLYFPYRNQYILNSMIWWILSSIFLLLVLVAFSLTIFYLYRQKFLNEIQKDFIQNVTHEFQTPLTTLIVGLDAISRPSVLAQPGKFDVYIKLMQSQTTYLKHHIENLMKVLKAEAFGLALEKKEVLPDELIEAALLQLSPMVEEKQATIHVMPDETKKPVQADRSSLYVALLNLLSNALKYSRHPVIDITTRPSGSRYSISIKDNGIGIEDKWKKKLFRKFYRVPAGDVHDVKGLGLGLYFVKKVIDGHKGTITVKSTPGNGAEFIIELPLN